MTTIKVEGLGPVEIKGDAPDADELAMIQAALKAGGSRTGAPGPKENPEGETIASMDTSKAQGFSQGTPLEAARDLIHGKRWGEVLKAFSPSTIFAAIAPLSTGNPRARQEIIVQQIPGAKAVDDKNGNPMIELDGKRYYTAGGDVDVGRAGLATALTLPALAVAPASVTGAALASGAIAGGQSLAEDAVAKAAGAKSQDIDLAKAGTSAIVGTLLPLGLGKVVLPLAGRLYAAVRSGTPLTDEALAGMGLTAEQIQSLTPELRQTIETVARRTFGSPTAVGSAYRSGLAKEFGLPQGPGGLTRGEITGDPAQIHREQTLASPGALPGSGYSRETILENRGVQDQQLNAAQERLRIQAGGGPPLIPEDAGRVLKQGYETAQGQAQAGVNQLYSVAKNPALLASAGMPPTVPVPYVAQLGQSVRASLAQTAPGRSVIDFPGLTPNTAQALKAVEEWAAGMAGPRGQGVNDISWEAIDKMRQQLGQFRAAANAPGAPPGDSAAMQQLIKGFDDHFGGLNPMLGQARAANTAKALRFNPGEEGQDKATKTALELLQGPEGGAKVVNTIFGSGMKTGEAAQMLDHLNTQVFPTQPLAREVMKEQALRRLVVDAKGDPLSPQKTVTALETALAGDRERPLYEKLFKPDELSRLQRFLELQRTIAASRTPINPPGSGTMILDAIKHLVGGGIGGTIGAKVGAMFGMPEAGAAVGIGAGTIARNVAQRVAAARAINPPANYGQAGLLGRPAMAAGLAAGQADQQGQLGPADRIMQGLLMGGP